MKNYIAHQGEKFTIEWYVDERGSSPALNYYESLPLERKVKVAYIFKVMGQFGRIMNEQKFRYEGDQIYAFKPFPDRFLCFFFKGAKIIVTNAFEKKTDKLPAREKTKALKYMHDYISRQGSI